MISISHGKDHTSESLQLHNILSIGSWETETCDATSTTLSYDGILFYLGGEILRGLQISVCFPTYLFLLASLDVSVFSKLISVVFKIFIYCGDFWHYTNLFLLYCSAHISPISILPASAE